MIGLCDDRGTISATVDPLGARIATLVDAASGRDILFAPPWFREDYAGQFPDADSNVEWHRRYPGGWHVLIPHVGDSVTVDGVTHPFHGEAAWRPWAVVDSASSSCDLRIVLRTVPLEVRRRVSLSERAIEVTTTVANYSGERTRFSWAEHPTLSAALIDASTTVSVGGQRVPLRIPQPPERHSAMTSVPSPGTGNFEVSNPRTGLRVSASWDPAVLPFVNIWQEHRDSGGSPWFHSVDALALEPSSRHYMLDGEELGPLNLEGGESMTTSMRLAVGGATGRRRADEESRKVGIL